MARVIGIRLKGGDQTGRGRIHEAFDAVAARLQRLLKAADIVATGLQVHQLDGRHATRANEFLVTHDRSELFSKLGQRREIERGLARDVTAKSGQSLRNVRRVAHLAEFTIADDGHAGLDLMRHGGVDRRLNLSIEFVPVIGIAVVSREKQRYQFISPRETANMGRQNCRHHFSLAIYSEDVSDPEPP